jgi:Glycosyl hydrolase family 26
VVVTTSIRSKIALFASLATFAATMAAAPASASATIKLGVFNSGAPANAQTVANYTAMVGRQPDIVMWYTDFGHSLLTSEQASTLKATGQAPLVTWEPYDQSLSAIASGAYDSYLRDSARVAKDWGGELMIRFAHEMNGSWYPWSHSSSYVDAWRHIVSVFRAEGANNVKWVWAPNVNRTGSMPFSAYFPGDDWVDYVGLDGYNWGDTPGNQWSSLKEVFSASYTQITQLSAKPLLITETSSSETGGDKAEWIRTGFMKTIPEDFPRVTGVIWFNKAMEDNWPLTSSSAALDAYREVVGCSYYGGSGPCNAGGGGTQEPVAVEALHVPSVVTAPDAGPRGTVTYRLSQRAKVRIKVQSRKHGRRYVRRVVVNRDSHAGRNRLPLRQLIGNRQLHRGSYRVIIVASGGEGQRSKPRKAHFRVR